MNSTKKPRIGLIFGGPGMENAISCISAMAIWKNINRDKYQPVAIAWAKNRRFYASEEIETLISHAQDANRSEIITSGDSCQIEELNLDLVFPITHGQGGEDGEIQGYFASLGLPLVGCSVLTSASCFHKDVCKRILASYDLPVVPGLTYTRGQAFPNNDDIHFPVFVKPAASGSSVGVSKVMLAEELIEAMETAFVEGKDLLIEAAIEGRELECAFLLGRASGVAEIKTDHEFYSWDAKYIDPDSTHIDLNADIPKALTEKIQELTLKACQALKIDSFARVDFFYDEKNDKLYINEVNTLPGFTSISMFPQLWEAAGVPFEEQVSLLIEQRLPQARRA
jgi:D-alanine-D-alanine ligase